MGKKLPVAIIGYKTQGKSKGAPLHQVNRSSSPQRGLTEVEIDQFSTTIQKIITRRQENRK